MKTGNLCLLLMFVMLGMCGWLVLLGHACLAFTFAWAAFGFGLFAVMESDAK